MSDKPVIALLMPEHVARQMFRERDLQELAGAARIVGPIMPERPEEMAAGLKGAVAVLAGWGSPQLDAGLLDLAPKLKLVAYSAGTVRFIATDEMYARGVRITTAAEANAVPVADFTVGMMVSLLKQVPWVSRAMAEGDEGELKRRAGQIRELQDITVGLIGASRVGRHVIRLLRSYQGVKVRVYDPFLSEKEAAELGVVKSSLEEACGCEVVSLHAPDLPATRHMMNAGTLGLLPDHGVFINTARGGLVDEAALLAEVRRRPLYVLLDVTDPEPPEPDSALRREKNIILTPHLAGAMCQGRKEMGRMAIDEVLRFLRGEGPMYEVTAAMRATQA